MKILIVSHGENMGCLHKRRHNYNYGHNQKTLESQREDDGTPYPIDNGQGEDIGVLNLQ